MKTLISALVVGLAISFGAASIASAETATTPTTTPTTTAPETKAKTPEKPRSAKSIECSKKADAQNLHGKKRRTFRKECMKGST